MNTPTPAEPVGLHGHGEFRQVAPLAVHQVVHALLAAHLVLAVRVIRESRQDQLRFEIVGIQVLQRRKQRGELMVIFRKRFRLGFQAVRQHLADTFPERLFFAV